MDFSPNSLTFAPGERNKQVTLTVNASNNDNKVEGDVQITYTLTGSFPDDVTLDTDKHVVTFMDDDTSIVGFASGSSTLREGDGTETLRVVLSNPVSEDVVLALSESGDTNNQVAFSPGSLTFASGETSKEITLTVVDDNTVEPGATITYTLAGTLPGNLDVSFGTRDHVVTFIDDDSATVGFATASSTLSEGDSTDTLTVSLSAEVSQDVVVTLTESGDGNNDLTFSPSSMTFASGETDKQVILTVNAANNDNKVEEDVEITYTLTGAFSGNVGLDTSRTTHVVTFTDDDASIVGFTAPSSTLNEGDSTDTLTVSLSAEVSREVVVDLTESGDTNNEVAFSPSSLTFAPGDTSKDVTLTVVDDNRVEPGATITYTLALAGTPPDDVSLGTDNHVVTFIDDDSATVGFTSSSSTLSEGDSTTNLTVELSAPVSQDVIVTLTESGDDNNDLEFTPTSLTFAPGDTSHDVTLTVSSVNDNRVEEDVEITYTLTGTLPDDVGFGTNSHVVTFTDDDSSTVGFASGNSILREGDGTSTLRVVLSNPVSRDVVVALSESGDANDQVAFTPNSLTFAAGETSHNVTLTVVDDNTVEEDATITYTLTGSFPDDVGFGTNSHVVTFTDDDSSTIGFMMPSSTLSEGDSTAKLTVELSAPVSQDVVVTLTESGDGNNDLEFTPTSLTFAPGDTSHDVTLTVSSVNDNQVEEDVEITYTLTGTLPDDVSFGTREHMVTFTDDDNATVGFASPSSTLREGDGTAILRVVLSNPVLQPVEVTISESGDTNNEVAFSPRSVTFASRQTIKEITLTVVDDNTVEPGATITYTLAGTLPGNLDVSFGTQEHVVTFIDDDSATVGFARTSSTLSEGDSTDTLTVSLSAEVSQDVVVTLTESGDGNNDLTFSPDSLTFTPGERSKQVTLAVNASNNDNKVEEDVEITYTLTGTFSGNVRLDASRNTHVVTFMDDDSAMVGFTAPSSTLNEGDSTDTLTVSLSAPVSQDVIVTLTESGDDNNDLIISPETLTFAPGETDKQVTLTVNASNNDNKVEGDVQITYTLTGSFPDDVTLGTREHVVTFTDDDTSIVGFASGSSTLREGDGTATLRVVLTNPVSQDVVVALSESGDEGGEVSFAPSLLTFASGETSHNVTLTVVDDNRVEPGATITYTLTGSLPDDVSLGTDNHVVAFIDDDSSTIGFTTASSTLREDNGTATLRVVLTNPVSEDVIVTLSESGDTNNEVSFAPGSLTFTSGQTSKEITLTVVDDNTVEPGATITYTLTGTLPDDVTLGTREHVVTFMDDDSSTIGFSATSSTLSEGDSSGNLTVSLSAPVSQDVIVTLTESGDDNNDLTFSPSSLTFAPGETSHDVTLTVNTANNDNKVEEDVEITYTLTGTPPDDVSFGTSSHVVTFADDDSSEVGFASGSSTLREDDGNATLRVVLSNPVSQDVIVTLTESGDTNDQVAFTPNSLTFAGGETSHNVTLTVVDDNTVEPGATVTYTLTGTLPDDVSLGTRDHVVTFIDDDSATIGFATALSTLSESDNTNTLTISLSAPSAQTVTVTLTESGDDNNDLIISPETLTFAPGVKDKQVTLTVNDANNDNKVEEDVDITYTLTGAFSGNVRLDASRSTHVVTFTDDDSASVGFASPSSILNEGDSTDTLTVSLSAEVSQDVVVDLAESGDVNNDLTFSPTSLTFVPGETSKQVTLTVNASNNDNKVEEDVDITYTLTGSLPDGVSLGADKHVVTFADDDTSIVEFASSSSALPENDGTATLRVVLSNPVSRDVVVALSESGDANDQVAFTPNSLTFAAGETSHNVTLTVVDDNTVEEDATITYTLTGSSLPDDVSLGTREHVVTLIDDDSSTIGFTTASSSLLEGDSSAELMVRLSAAVSQIVEVVLSESGDGNNDLTFSPSLLIFMPGETDKQVTLTVNASNNDNKVEGDVHITYTLTGSFPDDVTLGTREHVVIFTDDDSATVGFASGSSTLSEDDGTATLRVVLSNPVSEDVVLALNESGDANNEVAFTPSSLTFASGQTSKEITLTVENDNKVEPGATIIYTLTGSLPDDVTLDIREHMVTLTDDDSATVGFTSSSSTLSEDETSPASLTVSLSAEVSQDVVVTLTESGDDNNDLEFAPTSLTFAPGERSKQVTLTVNAANNDNKVEEDVEITYTLTGAFSGNVGLDTSRTTHVVTFTDDDASIVGFASSSSALSENDGTEILSVVLTNPVSQDVIVTLTESGDINNQVAFTPNSLTFAGGETSHNVTLTVVDDNTVEPGATITYTLTGTFPDDVTLGTREHVVTLTDDDTSIVGFASGSSILREGDGTATLSIVLTNPVSEDVVVTLNESGDVNDDLTFSPSSLLFTPGETSHNVTLTVSSADDNRVEEDVEITYTLTGSNLPADVSLGTSSHVVTFTDDDSAMVGFTAPSSTLRENEGTATLRVELTNPVSEDVIVTLTESGDGNDQVAFSPSSVIFASGQTSKEITLTVENDNRVEPGATITYTLTGSLPDDVSLGTDNHVVTLIDDDSATVGFTSSSSTLSEGDSSGNLTVSLNAEVSQSVEVVLTESGDDNNDLTFSPSSLTFAPGETDKQVTLTVNASNNDNKVEGDVQITYTLTGSFPDDVTLDTDKHVVTFTDDDTSIVGFASSSSTLSEDETSTASLTVSLSAEVSQGVVVDLTENGDDNGDLIISPETLTFAPGETSKQVTLTVNTANNDTAPEGDVQITYTLALAGTPPDDVSLGTREHVVTFTDDDKTISFKEFSSSASEGTIGHSVAVVLNFDPPAEGLEVSAVAKGDHKDDVSIPLPVLNFTGSTRELPVLVDVLDDIEQEDAEVVQLELEETSTPLPLGWTLLASGDNDHDLTIEPNDKTIGFADTLPAEIEEGAGDLPLEIVWNAPISHSVSLDLGVELEKADDGDSQNDVTLSAFVTASQTPSMITEYDTNAYIPRFYSNQPASGSSQRLTIRVVDDAIAEEDEEVIVRLVPQEGRSLPAGWSIDPAEYRFTIPANDNSVEFADPLEQTVEEDVGEVMIPLDVTSVPPMDGLPLRVEIAGHGRHADTATTDDYSFDPLAFTLMPAEAGEGYNLVFSITDDDLPETRETFAITLHAGEGFPTGWGGLGAQTTRYLTILPNDKTIGFADTLPAELEEGTFNFPLEVVWNVGILNWETLRLGVEMEKAVGGGTDPEEFDVLLEFPPDTFNEFQDTSHESDYLTYTGSAGSDTRIEMNVQDDKLLEEDEEIVVRLVPKQESPLPPGWSIDPAEYRFTIPANDKFVGFAAADSSLVEPNGDPGAQVSGNVVVKLNGPAPVGGLNLVVSVNEENNDDGGNIDANVAIGEGGVLFISEGATEISFPVTVLEDDIAESNEPVVLTLSKGANWPELWEIGGIAETGNLSGTHTVTILGNDKKVGFRQATRKLVSEANYASVSPVVTNYPAPAGGLDLTVNVESHTGSYARADVRTDGSGDLSYQENVRIRPNSRFEGVNTVAPVDDGIAEPDEAAVFRLSVAGGGQLPPGWEWSNQDLEVIILANDNDFTFTDGDNDDSKGSYSEGTTVRLTAVVTNPLPSPVSDDDHETFSRRVGYFGIEVTENSEDISITPVAPVIYHSYYHHPDGSRKAGISQPIKGGQDFFADYAFTVTEGGQLESVSFDVAIHEDSKTEPPETVVITLSISGSWGLRPTTRQYTLTINDEGGTGMIGFREGEMPYGLYERASLSTQRPGVLVELSSPSPPGGIDLMMLSSDPGQLLVGRNIHVPENRRGCYVTQLPVSTGSNYHFPEHRERCYFTDFNTISDGIPEGDETYDIIISEDPARPLPPKWSIDSERSRREVTIYSSDNKVGIAGFKEDKDDELIQKDISLDEDAGKVYLVLDVPNDPLPGGLHLSLEVTPDATTPGATAADLGIYPPHDFTIPRRNQAGPFQHVIEIPITDDTDAEQLESFSFNLQFRNAFGNHNTWGNVDWGNNNATLTIYDSDHGTLGFMDSGPVEIAEGESKDLPLDFSVLPTTTDVSILLEGRYSNGNPVQENNTDISFAERLDIPQGTRDYNLEVEVLQDEDAEADEIITISIVPVQPFPDSLELVNGTIDVLIPANDNNVCLMKCDDDDDDHEFSEGGEIRLRIVLSAPAPTGGLPMYIAHTSTDAGSEEDGLMSLDDYTAETVQIGEYPSTRFTIPAGATEYELAFQTVDDDILEEDEHGSFLLFEDANFPFSWGAVPGSGSKNIVIPANDFGGIGFTLSGSEAVEGNEDSSGNNVTISLSKPLPYAVIVNVTVEELDNDGVADITITGNTNKVLIPPQIDTGFINFRVVDDELKEQAEEVVLRLSVESVQGAGDHTIFSEYANPRDLLDITQETHTITIKANDNKIEFAELETIADEGDGTVPVKLVLSNPAPTGGLNLVLERENTQAPFDYALAGHDSGSGTRINPNIHIVEGAEEHVLSIEVIDDDAIEIAESFDFTIRFAAGVNEPWGRIGEKSTHKFTIRDSDFGTIGFAQSSATLVEVKPSGSSASREMNLGVQLSHALPVNVKFKIFGRGSDTDGSPDVEVDGADGVERMIPEGQTTASFTIRPALDEIAEPDELITYTIVMLEDTVAGVSIPNSLEVSSTPFELTIPANENTVRYTTLTSTAEEGESIEVGFILTNPAPDADLAFTFRHFDLGSSIAVAGVDYTGDIRTEQNSSGENLHFTDVTIPAGETSHKVVFDIVDDDMKEEVEKVRFTITGTSGIPMIWGMFGEQIGHDVTIVRNDQGIVGFDMESKQTTLVEGEVADLKISLMDEEGDPVSALPGSVDLQYAVFEKNNGTASNDLEMVGGTPHTGGFTIPANHDPTQPFILRMQAINDGYSEMDEILEIRLSFGSNYPADWGLSSTKSTHDILIPANENIVRFANTNLTLEEEEEDRTYMIEVTSSTEAPVGGLPLEVVKIGNSQELQDSDYIFTRQTFKIREGESIYQFPFTVRGDTAGENDEEIRLELSKRAGFPDGVLGTANWGNLNLANSTMTITISANDNTISFASAGPTTLQEGSDRVNLEILIEAPVQQDFQLDIEVTGEDGMALQELAFDLGGAKSHTTLNVPANASSIMLPVWAYNDTNPDAEKRATITISTSGVNADRTRSWKFVDNTHEVILPANDNKIEFEKFETIANEGESIEVGFTLTNPAPDGGLAFTFRHFKISGDSAAILAEAGMDYTGDIRTEQNSSGENLHFTDVTIPAGETSHKVVFDIVDDNLKEDVEKVRFTITGISGIPMIWGMFGERSHDVTITPNNQSVDFAQMTVFLEEEEEDRTYMIEVTSSTEAPVGGLPLKVVKAGGNVDESDYSFTQQIFTILEGESSYQFPFTVRADTAREDLEVIRLELIKQAGFPDGILGTANWGGLHPSRRFMNVIILANDNLVGFVGSSIEVEEDVGSINLTLNLTGDTPPSGLRMRLNISGQHQPADIGGTVSHDFTIPWRDETGSFQHVIPIPITDDDDTEDDKLITFGLSLLDNSWGEIDTNNDEFDLTILKNDQWFGFIAETSVEIAEGTTGHVYLYFSSPVSHPATFMFHTDTPVDGISFEGTSIVPVDGYEIKNLGQQQFNAWKFPISVTDDEITEGEQSFRLYVTPGPNVPDYYTLNPVYSYIDIIIPASDQ